MQTPRGTRSTPSLRGLVAEPLHKGFVPSLGSAWILCPDKCSLQLCVQEIIWRHEIGVWEAIPALGWAAFYIRRGDAVFSSVFESAEGLVCFERRERPFGEGTWVRENSGAVLEAPGGLCTGRARCPSCTASAGSSWSTSPWWMSSWGCWPCPTRKGRAPWRGNNRGLNTLGCFWGLVGAQGCGRGWTPLAWDSPQSWGAAHPTEPPFAAVLWECGGGARQAQELWVLPRNSPFCLTPGNKA